MSKKIKFLIGVIFIVLAFVGGVSIIYFMINAHVAQIEELDEKIVLLNAEKTFVERQASELAEDVGKSLQLENIINEAKKVYTEDESSRQEGVLWIDRGSQQLVITLGALHGLIKGSILNIYDDTDNNVGTVKVEMPFDVISHVQPLDISIDQLNQDYYKVIIKE